MINELKSKDNGYICYADDPIDVKLAQFINTSNNPGALKRLFEREKPGIYKFGQKSLLLRVEREKLMGKNLTLHPLTVSSEARKDLDRH